MSGGHVPQSTRHERRSPGLSEQNSGPTSQPGGSGSPLHASESSAALAVVPGPGIGHAPHRMGQLIRSSSLNRHSNGSSPHSGASGSPVQSAVALLPVVIAPASSCRGCLMPVGQVPHRAGHWTCSTGAIKQTAAWWLQCSGGSRAPLQ